MPEFRGWRVWYAGGDVYTSNDYNWRELPEEGVVAVVVYQEEPYRIIRDGGDWYWLDDDMIPRMVSSGAWGTWQDKPKGVPKKRIKKGVLVSDEEYELVVAEYEGSTWP